MQPSKAGLPIAVVLALSACGDSDAGGGDEFPLEVAEEAIAAHKELVFANYEEVLEEAKALQRAVDSFLAYPGASGHEDAKQAWITARLPYGPSEAFRFYDGPIDNPDDGPEGQINAWPLDEAYIDYVRDMPEAGLINDVSGTPELTEEVIVDANEAAGEDAISTGYHAVEFLLWGQDDAESGMGAGKRPYTDYLTTGGTADNQARRKEYLSIVINLLVEDLEGVTEQWDPDVDDNFAARFGEGDEDVVKDTIGGLLRALGSMANAELSGERMTVAYKNRSMEDEHSCFSDNTAPDLHGNGVGIQNVWLGKYGSFDGVGVDEVVAAVDEELAEKTTDDIADAVEKLQALVDLQDDGTPIDVVIDAEDGSPEREAMLDAINALKVVGDDIEDAATALGLSVQLEEPSEEL